MHVAPVAIIRPVARGSHPNSRANLQRGQRFKPGFDPRRAMPTNVGESLLHWMSVLEEQDDQGLARYDEACLKTIISDGKLSRTKRAAAAHLMRLTSEEFAKNGLPFANADLERLLDRTVGRPKQSIEVTRRVEGPSLPDIIKEAQAIAKQLGATVVNRMVKDMEAQHQEEQAQRDNCRALPAGPSAAAGPGG